MRNDGGRSAVNQVKLNLKKTDTCKCFFFILLLEETKVSTKAEIRNKP